MSKKIWLWSFVNAFGTLAYIAVVAMVMSNGEKFFGQMPNWMGPVVILLLFVLSASITAALVLGRPIWWYMEGAKKEAVKLFGGTLGWLAMFLLIFILISIVWRATASAPTTAGQVGMANPASVNCADKGGRLVIQKNSSGGEYGLCYFDDNRACEEWAMMRGECPVGGVKTTGYDTDAQKYCAWVGGRTAAVANAVCTFADGSTCLADDLYSGKCARGVGSNQLTACTEEAKICPNGTAVGRTGPKCEFAACPK